MNPDKPGLYWFSCEGTCNPELYRVQEVMDTELIAFPVKPFQEDSTLIGTVTQNNFYRHGWIEVEEPEIEDFKDD